MRAILIDTTNSKIEEIDIVGDLKSWYEKIGNKCELVETAIYLDDQNCIVVDEEGFLKESSRTYKFHIDGSPHPWFAGNGIVVGTNEDGDTIDTDWNVDNIKKIIEFYRSNNEAVSDNIRRV